MPARSPSIDFRGSLARQSWRLGFLVGGFVSGLAAALALSAVGWGAQPGVLLRDPNASAGQPPYYGVISTLGAAVWLSAGASALLAWAATSPAATPLRKALLLGGVWNALMALDDLLMLHEGVLPMLGISEAAALALYGGLGAAFLLRIAPVALATDWTLLAAGLVALSASALADFLESAGLMSPGELQLIVEDVVFKLGGILFLSAFLLRLAYCSLRPQAARV